MNKEEVMKMNQDGWNKLIKNNCNHSNTSLPEYGPFMENEEKLQLFKDVENKKVLELGCAAGKSLAYLKQKGASEVWGLDISEEQIKKAIDLSIPNSHFIISPMEDIVDEIPANYFDYVLSLYSIGFSADLKESFISANHYLKENGKFILCWTHPFFNTLTLENDKILVGRSYLDENVKEITKSDMHIPMAQFNYKISTLVNSLIDTGFVIDQMIEENTITENHIGNYQSSYWDARKLGVAPTTLIIIAHKK